MQKILLNQIGFLPGMQKSALFRGVDTGSEFQIVDLQNEKSVYTGTVGAKKYDHNAGETVCCGDFTELAAEGSYYITVMAYEITSYRKYYDYASEQLAYLLGKNPMDICYVTGYGANFPRDPHHRPSIAKETAVRGMVVGGPNKNMQDELTRQLFRNAYPALCYIDDHESYSTNEVDTYWNTLAVLLSAFIIKYCSR